MAIKNGGGQMSWFPFAISRWAMGVIKPSPISSHWLVLVGYPRGRWRKKGAKMGCGSGRQRHNQQKWRRPPWDCRIERLHIELHCVVRFLCVRGDIMGFSEGVGYCTSVTWIMTQVAWIVNRVRFVFPWRGHNEGKMLLFTKKKFESLWRRRADNG